MIRADIATVALSEHIEERIRIAALLLVAHKIRAHVRPWDGTRCDAIVSDLSDAYGRQAFERAKMRATPALLFNAPAQDIGARDASAAESDPADVLSQHLRALLAPQTPAASPPETAAAVVSANSKTDLFVDDNPQTALCRLTTSAYSGLDIDATRDGLVVRIRPQEGRVYAPDFDKLHAACASFASEDWTFAVVAPHDERPLGDASRSLEVFLLQSAFQGRERLPRFPEGRLRMQDWPDVGSAPELVGALKVARALIRNPADANELCASCEMDPLDVNASLWAYRAADLLEASTDAPPPQTQLKTVGQFSGLVARVARRFGLGRN